MREIKFRAWDSVTQEISYVWDMTDILSLEYVDDEFRESDYRNEITFLQYIWLKDKNGKEVYEWDIFKKDNTIWDIRWNDYHMCYNMYYFYGLDDVVDSLRDFEIIWNIYENPELLEFNS